MKFGIGQAVTRLEDVPLVTGRGRYTGDLVPADALHAAVVRSPHAHARFSIGDLADVWAVPGTRLIFTHADVAALGDLPVLGLVKQADGSRMSATPYPVLPKDTARHVGDALAFVVADTPAAARQAAEAMLGAIDFEPLPAAIGARDACAAGAPQVWAERAGNVAFVAEVGDKGATDAAFARAAKVVRLDITNNRLVTNYLELRGVVAAWDGQRHTLTLGSQGSHVIRDLLCDKVLKIPRQQMRVITPDVGGGFGTKIFVYREYALAALAAKALGRTVAWLADRSEHFLGDTHGRDWISTTELALDAEHRFLALRINTLADMGAYLSQFAPFVPTNGHTLAPGVYGIAAMHATITGVFTHTLPVDAYRGAGRPEAAYLIERLVDVAARDLGVAPDALRALNYVPPSAMPWKAASGRTYDTGDFAGQLARAKQAADWDGFAARAAAAKAHGRVAGIGVATYIEACSGGSPEPAQVSIEADGTALVLIGSQTTGQGHVTAYAQLASHHLGLPPERIRVLQGDTDIISEGTGTGGSRSIPVGGAAVEGAARQLAETLREIAGEALEAPAADIELMDGAARIAGTDRAIAFADLAHRAGGNGRLSVRHAWKPPEATYPNGTHVCEVEIDPQTGQVRIVRYTVVDDFGVTLNPLLLAGQVHGGVVQGIGQALIERTVYDTDGQLVTASLMDYGLPRADDVPSIAFETRNVPSTTNVLGMKGAGEAGAIGSCPAVMNAVVDALHRGFGVRHLDMPATPERVWAAIGEARRLHRL